MWRIFSGGETKMKKDKIRTLETLIKKGGVFLDTSNNVDFYEIGNQKYLVKDNKVIYTYFFDDTNLREDDKK